MAKDDLNKVYQQILARRQANVDKNLLEGRTLGVSDPSPIIDDISDKRAIDSRYEKILNKREANIAKNLEQGRIIEDLGTLPAVSELKGPKTQNLESEIKKIAGDAPGIDRAVAFKSKFPKLKEVISATDDIIPNTKNIIKNTKGFIKPLQALGLGATALAGLSIANKVQAGELGEAGLESADLATDYIPMVGQAKMALRPTELGNSELPEQEMAAREIYNNARLSKSGESVNNPSKESPLLAPEDRVKKEDFDKLLKQIALSRK